MANIGTKIVSLPKNTTIYTQPINPMVGESIVQIFTPTFTGAGSFLGISILAPQCGQMFGFPLTSFPQFSQKIFFSPI